MQRIRILFNPSPQKALICGKERIDDLPAVLIMQTIIYHCVDAIVQIHAARGLRSCKQIILPAVQIKRPSLLRLGDCGNVAQRDVDHVIGGVLGHSLHQLTNAGHNGDAVIFCACVGVNRIDAHNDRDLCWVQLIALRRRRLFQGVLRAYFRPIYLGVSIVLRRIRSEDQHAVLTIYFGGRTGNGRIVRAGKGKLHPIDALAVLVHFLYAQLAALVGDVDDRAELTLELVGVQEREIAPAKVARDAELGHNALNHLVGGLSRLLSSLDRIGNIALKAVVELLGGVALDTELLQSIGLDDAVDHLHVALVVVQQITVRAPRKVLQQALELPGVLVVGKAPLGPALVACLVQSGLQHSFAPRLGLALCWGYGAVALRVASVERLPLSVVSHFVVGHIPFQQHGHGNNQAMLLAVRIKLGVARCDNTAFLIELAVRQLSRLTDVREEAGVRACLVAVRNDKHGVVGVEPQHDIFRQSPIAASRLGFLQNVVQRSVGMVLVGEAEGRAIGTGERCLSVLARHQRTNLAAIDGVIVSIEAFAVLGRRLVQVKLHTFKRIAVLVYLLDAVREGRLEVEAHLQTGIVVAALQIKHLQAVLGAGGEDLVPLAVGGPMERIRLILSQGGYKHFI